MRRQRKYPINQKEIFYYLSRAWMYPFSVQSWVEEKTITKILILKKFCIKKKFLKTWANGDQSLQFMLRMNIWQGKRPPISSAESGRTPKILWNSQASWQCHLHCRHLRVFCHLPKFFHYFSKWINDSAIALIIILDISSWQRLVN